MSKPTIVPVSGKETKDILLKFIKERDSYIKELEASTLTPEQEQARRVKLEAVEKAAEAIEKGIFSKEVEAEYKSLVTAVNTHQARLEELYGVEKELQSMATAIASSKDVAASLKLEEAIKRKEQKAAIEEARIAAEEQKAIYEEENEAYKEKLELARAREEDEFQYELKKRHRNESDILDAVLEKKEAVVDKKLEDAALVLKEAYEKEAEVEDKIGRLETIDEDLKQSYESGRKDGEAKAKTSFEFEKRELKSNYDHELELLKQKETQANDQLSFYKEENIKLAKKLDEAYNKIQEIALGAVKVSGPATSSADSVKK